jgi:hypothetical protein
MKDIKWITLYDEWHPLTPVDLQKYYQYYHKDPGPEQCKKSKLNRGESSAARTNQGISIDINKTKRKREQYQQRSQVLQRRSLHQRRLMIRSQLQRRIHQQRIQNQLQTNNLQTNNPLSRREDLSSLESFDLYIPCLV